MEKVDLTKAAGFQAVDSEGNVLGTVSMEQLTDSIASKLAAELSAQNSATPVMRTMSAATTMAAATSTGSDKMENAFTETTDPAYVRVIDKNGNSAKQGIKSFASVVGGLIGTATVEKDGLLSKDEYVRKFQELALANNLIFKIAKMKSYTYVRLIGGSSGRSLSIIDFGVSMGASGLSIIGQKPSFISLKKGTDNSIYVMAPTGEMVSFILLGSAVISIENVSQFPSDAIDLT